MRKSLLILLALALTPGLAQAVSVVQPATIKKTAAARPAMPNFRRSLSELATSTYLYADDIAASYATFAGGLFLPYWNPDGAGTVNYIAQYAHVRAISGGPLVVKIMRPWFIAGVGFSAAAVDTSTTITLSTDVTAANKQIWIYGPIWGLRITASGGAGACEVTYW